jgi:flavin-binding protein dodecin
MADSIYSVSEIVGSSTEGIDDAIRGAVARASKTLHNLDWFEVTNTRAGSRATGALTSRSP